MSQKPKSPETIFGEAIAIDSPNDRAAFLDEACGDEPDLRRELEKLVMDHFKAGDFLENPAVSERTIDQPITEKPGTVIGPYKLLQKIGEGGFGVVYMADQTEPVKRRVAIKIIKPGMDTRQVIARFEAERQALAMMDHPNIARVLDAGTTDSGRPYFVMELVKGVPITQFCDEKHLTPRERLELFVPVCQAIQHAHQKGIIHRDIKPSNVLIAEYDDRAIPKVIDFGVAKAVEQQLTEKTMFTQLGQVIGTVDYMSPEQAKFNQLDIDTRSDVYSLGVLIYELLTGATPFDRQRLRSAAFDELLRIIREEEPPKPSLRLSTSESLPSIAANRQIEPKKLSTLVRGELDWIVMKALEKDRARRYETATGFASDIQRYLDDEPVVACPPSAGYRFRKFARRNKAFLSMLAIVVTALILGMIGTTWQAIRATNAEELARERLAAEQQARGEADQARQAEAEQRLLAEGNLKLANAEQERAEDNFDLALEALDAVYLDAIGRDKLLGEPIARPQGVEASFATPPPLTDLERDLLERGLDFYDQFAQQNTASRHAFVQTAQAYYRVGLLQGALGETGTAAEAYRGAIERFEKLAREEPENVEHFRRLAEAYRGLGSVIPDWPSAKEALEAGRDACSRAIAISPNDPSLFAERGAIHHAFINVSSAISDCKEAVRLESDNAFYHHKLADAYEEAKYQGLGLPDEELLLHAQRAVSLSPNNAGYHLHIARLYHEHLQSIVTEADRSERSLHHLSQAIAIGPPQAEVFYQRAKLYAGLSDEARAHADIARGDAIASKSGRAMLTRAEAFDTMGEYREVLDSLVVAERLAPNIHGIHFFRGEAHIALGEYALALESYTKLSTMAPHLKGGSKRRALAYFHLGEYGKALADLREVRAKHPSDASALWWIPPALVATCPDEAFKEGLLQLADEALEESPSRHAALYSRAILYLGLGLLDKGRADLREAVAFETASFHTHYMHSLLCLFLDDTEEYRNGCATMLKRFGKSEESREANFVAWTCVLAPDAVEDYEPVVALSEKAVHAKPENDQYLNTLGAILYRAGRYDEAIERLTELDRRRETADGAVQSSPAYTWYFLAMAHQKAGNEDQAREYLNKANQSTDKTLDDEENPPAWNRRATLEILRKEAEALIEPDAPESAGSDQKPEGASNTKTDVKQNQGPD